jgi:hypothetical protein
MFLMLSAIIMTGLSFDGTIGIGSVVSVVLLIIGFIASWYKLQAKSEGYEKELTDVVATTKENTKQIQLISLTVERLSTLSEINEKRVGPMGSQGDDGSTGPTGAPGAPGATGAAAGGNYSSIIPYVPGSVVVYRGNTYLAIAASLDHAPPNTEYWAPISTSLGPTAGSQGDRGNRGNTGSRGPRGADSSK